MNIAWYAHLAWIAAAGLLSFLISAIFSARLQLRRNIFLIPYIGLSFLFFLAYVKWSGLSIPALIQHNWIWGILGAVLLSFITIRQVLSQPASPRAKGVQLAFELLWPGFLYGLTDGLLLSVFPVIATWQAFTLLNWTVDWPGKILVSIFAILASMFVTTTYHAGYIEFRGRRLIIANIGNTIMTLGCIITANPMAAMICHPAMHMAAVLHGPAKVVQLPPHYK